MEYSFALDDGRRFTIKSWGNLAVEAAAIIAGVKPATQCWIETGDRDYLEQLCAAFGWRSLIYERQRSAQGQERLAVMIGPREAALSEAAEAWQRPQSNPGPQLGYPPCCSEFYCRWINEGKAGLDVIPLILRHTPEPWRLPFALNDLFYWYSRPPRADAADRRERLCRVNAGLDVNVLNVVPWHPCSYRCEASLSAAAAILRTMKARCPALAAAARACLTRPALFWDWDRFAVLDGRSEGETVVFKGLRPPFSLLEDGLAAAVRAADRLTVEADGVPRLWTGRRRGPRLEGAVLLDFCAS